MILWCYDDAHHWGDSLMKVAKAGGLDARLFDDPREPRDGYAFMHMHHHPQVRTAHKRIAALLAMEPSITMIPSYRASVLFDDKLEQARQFAIYLPRTRVFYTPGSAHRWLALANYPFVSKSLDGASSHNVRLVENYDQAKLEIRQAFSDIGIKTRYGQQQRGYLLWQDFIPECDGDLRVIAVGSKRLVLRRRSRDDARSPINGGSSRIIPISGDLDADTEFGLIEANVFFEDQRINWGAVDLIFDKRDRSWKVIEFTVSWTLHGYYDCCFFDCSDRIRPRAMPIKGDKIWDVLVDEIKAGEFISGP